MHTILLYLKAGISFWRKVFLLKLLLRVITVIFLKIFFLFPFKDCIRNSLIFYCRRAYIQCIMTAPCVLQAQLRFLAEVLWPPGSVPCCIALVVTSWQTSCLEAAPLTISNTTATSCWPQLSGEKEKNWRKFHFHSHEELSSSIEA